MTFDRLRDDNEAYARLKINQKLIDAGWFLTDTKEYKRNVKVEQKVEGGFADYELLDSKGFPLCVIEAKKPSINPLSAKEQARRYAVEHNIRFVILSNGEICYLWDIKSGNPQIITSIPTQESLEKRQGFNPHVNDMSKENIIPEYVALQKNSKLLNVPEYQNVDTRSAYCWNNGLRILRDYQIEAVKSVQKAVMNGKNRFLIEMATGLGKTLTAGAIIQMFLRTGHAHRVLFLVDRIELEQQAWKNFSDYLCNFITVIYKEKSKEWHKADIVVSTIQTLMSGDKYKVFSPTDFDFIISDEAHRSIGGNSRAVFEYFIGYKLGLTATPRDYIKNVDIDKIKIADPKSLERRLLLDTYNTFGCDNGEPTYKYTLMDGIKNGYLIGPVAIDARTDITTQMLSDKGYHAIGIDGNGENVEADVVAKDFEKRFFNDNVNAVFCKTFIENAERDPISGEIGKSLIFCVSQEHAAKITQILNEMAMQAFPDKYNSDFAIQVTSSVQNAQQMTNQFSENNLSGTTTFLEGYKSSKTRICVTVGMMTTGYDCSDILNVVFMRPVFSPTDFVQMKGRGTRKHTFKYIDVDKNETIKEKISFKLFDFFGNCEYFEEKFDYGQQLKLPPLSKGCGAGTCEPRTFVTLTSEEIARLVQLETLNIPEEGMRIDREFWGNFQNAIREDDDIKKAVDLSDWDNAVALIKEKYENKPDLYPNLEKIKKATKIDRRLSWREILEHIFGLISRFKTRDEMLEEECEKCISIIKPDAKVVSLVKNYIKLYVTDNVFRNIIETEQYPRLNVDVAGFSMQDLKDMGKELREKLPVYIKENIILNHYMG
ncbi:MAG: DEAD/DEAH box helicase family protein [Alphaproteobacteria bacterium]|nr:DEAD/DEAH box helicase family protein [Alphaproteobacteria bacterium]